MDKLCINRAQRRLLPPQMGWCAGHIEPARRFWPLVPAPRRWDTRRAMTDNEPKNRVDSALEAAAELLALNPTMSWLDALVVDLNGIVRGKRYPRSDIEKLCRVGMQFPLSSFYLDVTGECLDPLGLGVSDGDPDGTAWVVADSFVPVPWNGGTGAQVLMALHDLDGEPSAFDARHLAQRALGALSVLGVHPVCAFELEFYLLDASDDATPRAAAGHGQVYRVAELTALQTVLDAVREACARQSIPASVVTSEYAPGQFEINLRHVPNALASADHAVMFKHLVAGVASEHGLRATFMAKPFLEHAGSGTHVHLSLVDARGNNLFDERLAGAELRLRHAIAGVLDTLGDAMLLYAPGANSYRRFVARTFVPVNRSWAHNNRSVALRVPYGEPDSRRLELRVPGADANPYLVLAALLHGVRRGLEARREPPPQASGNACHEVDPSLPLRWHEAIEQFACSGAMREDFGERFVEVFAQAKRLEADKFQQHIGAREYEWYL